MRILVIEDFEGNIASAKKVLEGHDVTICTDVQSGDQVLERAQPGDFDFVLTDLYLPKGSYQGAAWTLEPPQGDLPAGLIFAIKASQLGIPSAILTDSDHHNDWLCALLDLVNIGVRKTAVPIYYLEARDCLWDGYWDEESGRLVHAGHEQRPKDARKIKNWKNCLEQLQRIVRGEHPTGHFLKL